MINKLLITIFFLIIVSSPVYAENSTIVPTEGISPTPTITPTTINYPLPYPGILPGSPLYSLKALRDKIVEVLTSDLTKKSNLYLLQADKRLAASLILFGRGDQVNAETTLSKGQNYLEKSLNQAQQAKESQYDVLDVTAKIRMSSTKQKEEIGKLVDKTKGEIQQKLKGDYQRAQVLEKRASQFKP